MTAPFTLVLGTAQDGGVPHVGCREACCAGAAEDPRFIHFNHTNPVLDPGGKAAAAVSEAGMRLAEVGERFSL